MASYFRLRPVVAFFLVLTAAQPGHAQAVATEAPNSRSLFGVPDSDEGLPGAGPIQRAEWFRPGWNERREKWATRLHQDHGALVFLGDSITQGWGDDFRGKFDNVKTANRGISGDTTRGMLVRLADDVIALDPSGVVMLMGTNDVENGATPATIAGNVKLIVAELKEHDPQLPIVLCEVFPSSAEKNRPKDKIRELNRLLEEAVKGDPQVTLVDTWTLFANAEGNAKQELFPDLLHLNDDGYAKWAAALRPILATLGFLETEADDFKPEPGFELIFNGHDLTGWGVRPTPEADLKGRAEWQRSDPNAAAWPIITEAKAFDGQTASDGGRYVAKNGRLVVTTPAEGRKIEQLWTTREFPNDFTLKLEFQASPNADSGVYIRGPQLQCRDYPLAGPYDKLAQYRPQDWNELAVEVRGGVARCTCNGEVLEEEFAVPATGPIGLEGDRGQMEYRRIRIKESS
ncbi:MAG: GDSL-type esterase/lipase family protein [Pirellulales bacterium]